MFRNVWRCLGVCLSLIELLVGLKAVFFLKPMLSYTVLSLYTPTPNLPGDVGEVLDLFVERFPD